MLQIYFSIPNHWRVCVVYKITSSNNNINIWDMKMKVSRSYEEIFSKRLKIYCEIYYSTPYIFHAPRKITNISKHFENKKFCFFLIDPHLVNFYPGTLPGFINIMLKRFLIIFINLISK